MKFWVGLAVGATLVSAAHAADFSGDASDIRARRNPKGRDLYVGCTLFVNKAAVLPSTSGLAFPYSGDKCGAYAILALVNREGFKEGEPLRFCLPKTADIRTDPAVAFANAYIDYFEKTGASLADMDGLNAVVLAAIDKWPCQPPPR